MTNFANDVSEPDEKAAYPRPKGQRRDNGDWVGARPTWH